jgi:ribose 5-phosphate isomerase A
MSTFDPLNYIQDGHVVGLGSGRAAMAFVRDLGARMQAGLKVRGVPTSHATAILATQLGIPLLSFDQVERLDVAVDGADEVDPQANLIKGLGGALVREKIVASAARLFVILVGPEKLVPVLGSHGVLPVEVVPFALALCRRRLEEIGYPGTPRQDDKGLFLTDNHNHILDCKIPLLTNPENDERAILSLPGVVDTGLFLNMAHLVLVKHPDGRTEPGPRGQNFNEAIPGGSSS